MYAKEKNRLEIMKRVLKMYYKNSWLIRKVEYTDGTRFVLLDGVEKEDIQKTSIRIWLLNGNEEKMIEDAKLFIQDFNKVIYSIWKRDLKELKTEDIENIQKIDFICSVCENRVDFNMMAFCYDEWRCSTTSNRPEQFYADGVYLPYRTFPVCKGYKYGLVSKGEGFSTGGIQFKNKQKILLGEVG
jgi:hypothetical protein